MGAGPILNMNSLVISQALYLLGLKDGSPQKAWETCSRLKEKIITWGLKYKWFFQGLLTCRSVNLENPMVGASAGIYPEIQIKRISNFDSKLIFGWNFQTILSTYLVPYCSVGSTLSVSSVDGTWPRMRQWRRYYARWITPNYGGAMKRWLKLIMVRACSDDQILTALDGLA